MQRLEGPLMVILCVLLFAGYCLRLVAAIGLDRTSFSSPFSFLDLGDDILPMLIAGISLTATVGLVWVGAWALLSNERRDTADACSLESNRPALQLAPLPSVPSGPDSESAAAAAGVLVASLEHVVPSCGLSVCAGGLSKVLRMQLLHAADRPARTYKFVFPMVGGQDYSTFTATEPPVVGASVSVEIRREACGNVEFVALRHPLFLQRTKETIYPDARRR
jgi:hypothetical protein